MRKGTKSKSTKSFKSKARDRSKHSVKKYKNKARVGGGKGGDRWNDYGDYTTFLDHDDPNYNSEDEEPREMYYKKVQITLRQYKEAIKSIIREYFASEDSSEVITCLRELQAGHFHWEFVKRAMTMAFDKRPRERELVSRLFSNLYYSTLSKDHFHRGFMRVLEQMDDLIIDCPDVHIYTAQFLARAVADEVLPPAFLRNTDVMHLCKDVIERAKRILKRGIARVERVWGPVALKEIKAAIKALVEEFLMGGGEREAARSLLELKAPRYHHEFVKRAVVLAMDRKVASQEAVSRLFQFLYKHELVSEVQFKIGFDRLHEAMPDLKLDVPAAEGLLSGFLMRGKKAGYLIPDFLYQEPSAADLENMDDFEGPVLTSPTKADTLENFSMMKAIEVAIDEEEEEEEEEPELLEPGLTYEDHMNMQDFIHHLASGNTMPPSAKNDDYDKMKELEDELDSDEEAQQKYLETVAKYGRDLVRSGLR